MKFWKIAGLLAVAAAALMAVAGSASATVITSGGSAYTGGISASAEGHAVLDNPISKIECASTISGSVESHGAGVTGQGKGSSLTFTNCTNSWHVTVVALGSTEWHWRFGTLITVTSSGTTVEATRLGIICRYKTENTDLGLIKGSKETGATATFQAEGAIPFHSGSGLCGSGVTTLTGSYLVTAPDNLDVDA